MNRNVRHAAEIVVYAIARVAATVPAVIVIGLHIVIKGAELVQNTMVHILNGQSDAHTCRVRDAGLDIRAKGVDEVSTSC